MRVRGKGTLNEKFFQPRCKNGKVDFVYRTSEPGYYFSQNFDGLFHYIGLNISLIYHFYSHYCSFELANLQIIPKGCWLSELETSMASFIPILP